MAETKTKKLKRLRALRDQGKATTEQLAQIATLEAQASNSQRNTKKTSRQPKRDKRGGYLGVSNLRNLSLQPTGILTEKQYIDLMTNPGLHAETDNGACSVLAACHPWTKSGGFAGWPDESITLITVPTYVTETSIGYDPSMFSTPPTAPSMGDIRIIIPPGEINCMYQIYDYSTSAWSKMRVIREQTFERQIPGQTANWPVFMGDQGISTYRQVGKGATVIFDAPSLANAGTIYAGQLIPQLTTQELSIGTPGSNASPVASGQNYLFTLPNTTSALAQVDPSMYEERATMGCAMPLKMSYQAGSFPYVDTAEGGFTIWYSSTSTPTIGGWVKDSTWQIQFTDDSTEDAQDPVTFTSDSVLTLPIGVPTGSLNPYGNGGFNIYTAGGSLPSKNNWGIIYVKGIQLVSSTGAAATLRYKSKTHLEQTVYGPTAITPYLHTSPIYDPKAIQSVIKIQQLMPSAYPASANGFMDFLRKTVGWVAGQGRGLVKTLAGLIPGVGPLAAEVVDPVLDTANSLLNSGT